MVSDSGVIHTHALLIRVIQRLSGTDEAVFEADFLIVHELPEQIGVRFGAESVFWVD